MSAEHFMMAIAIISGYHTSKVAINLPKNNFVGNLGSEEFNLYLNACCAGCTKALVNAGYMLSMTEKGLSIDRI